MASGVGWLLAGALLLCDGPRAAGDLAGAELEDARAVVAALAKGLEGVARLRGDFEQRQTSLLLEEPLISRGRLHLRANPGCVVLELREPRAVEIRSDATSHQIYYPDLAKAERYLFESNEHAKAMLACFTGQVGEIEKAFVFDALEKTPETTTVGLRPREEKLRAILASLRLDVRVRDSALVGVTYVNADGEEVAMSLSNVELDPQPGEGPDVFDRPLPKNVRVVVQRVELPKK